jgi:hypothetical protein
MKPPTVDNKQLNIEPIYEPVEPPVDEQEVRRALAVLLRANRFAINSETVLLLEETGEDTNTQNQPRR